jgi:hypothetical protein
LKKQVLISVIICLAVLNPAVSEPLTEEYQQDLLDQLLHLKGQGPLPLSLEEAGMIKCGTPLLFQFLIHRDNFTGKYAVQAEALQARPVLALYHDSPGGHFRVHYDTTGNSRVYQPEISVMVFPTMSTRLRKLATRSGHLLLISSVIRSPLPMIPREAASTWSTYT